MSNATHELSLVKEALGQGDLPHATHHLLQAIGTEPAHPELPAQIAAWLDAAGPQAEGLLPRDEQGMAVDAAVLLAFIHQRAGRTAAALRLLLRTMELLQQAAFRGVALAWASEEALGEVDPVQLAGALAVGGEQREVLELADELLARAQDVHPDASRLALVRSRNARLAGEHDRALRIAEEQHARNPDYWACIALGTNRKETGDLEGAIGAFESALALKLDDDAARLDLGDLHLDRADWSAARRRYREVLELPVDHSWARPSWLYTELRLSDDPEWERQLRDFLREHPESPRARALLGRCRMYRYALPERTESSIASMRHAVAQGATVTSLAISSMEAPSALVSLRETAGEGFSLSFRIPDPDPRVPFEQVPFVLWRFSDEPAADPRPGLPAPPPAVSAAVARLAGQDYELEAWSEAAAQIAGELGGVAPQEILATMVHVPPPPEGMASWDWRFRVQVAAALVVARSEPGRFWESAAARALLAVLAGPVDWATTAAIVALTEVAQRDAEARPQIVEALAGLLDRPITPIWCSCALEPMVGCLLPMPGLANELRQGLRELRDDLEG